MKKVWGIRASLIGDTIMSLVALNIVKLCEPDSYVNFVIAKNCAQAAPLYFNHPHIDRIKITDKIDSFGKQDLAIQKECDIIFDCFPHLLSAMDEKHKKVMIEVAKDHGYKETDFIKYKFWEKNLPSDTLKELNEERSWFNKYNCVEHTLKMANLELEMYNQIPAKERVPYLSRWWDRKPFGKKHIAIWPFPAYGGGDLSRCPSEQQWKDIVSFLVRNGFSIHHFGWHEEPILSNSGYANHTKSSFMDQIKDSLNCDLIIGCDSGSTWATAAYHEIPQINLLRPRVEHGHVENYLAFAPAGPKCFSMVALKWKDLENDMILCQINKMI